MDARTITLLVLAATLSGCSVAAALAGADTDTVRAASEWDGVWIGATAGALAEVATAQAEHDAARAAPPPGTFLCWTDADGGEEVRAVDAARARAVCRSIHGEHERREHCRCEPIARVGR